MRIYPAACTLVVLCFLLAFSQSKQPKDGRLSSLAQLAARLRDPLKAAAEDTGLPGEAEYEVDLSDQVRRRAQRDGGVQAGEQEEEGFLFRFANSLINFKMPEDIADRLDDLICAWDKVMGTDFETLVLLLLGWLAFGGVIFLISHVIYSSLGTGEEGAISSPSQTIPPFKESAQQCLPKIAVNNNLTSPSSAVPVDRPVVVGPRALGSDPEVVEYVNKCWDHVYSNKKVRDEIMRLWLEKMNEFTKRSALDHANELVIGHPICSEVETGVYSIQLTNTLLDVDGLYVEFISLSPGSAVPTFSNMTAEPLPAENMSVSSDLNAIFSLGLKTTRPIREKVETAEFTLVVDKLRARFSVTVIQAERLLIVKLDGWPDLKLRVLPLDGVNSNLSREEQNLHELIEEIATSAIRGVQLDIRMDTVGGFPMFSRKTPKKPIAQNNKLSHGMSRGGSRPVSFPKANGHSNDGPMRLLDVKIVKAVQLGGVSGNCLEPYVVLEVDDPSQRHQTRPGTGPSTQWDETFTIEMSRTSSEILLEVWDQGQKIGKSDIFLGLGIVSVSELMVTVSQRHVIPLQGRPYEEDQVTGLLTIEFLFKDGGLTFSDTDTMQGVHRTLEMRQTKALTGGTQLSRKTTYSLYEPPDLLNGADVADLALKEIEMQSKERNGQQPTKSTLLIHSVQKRPHTPSSSGQSAQPDSVEYVTDSVDEISIASRDSVPGRRGRDKKRNLISTIKKRFSGTARSLSTSMKLNSSSRNPSESRGASLDRVRSASEHGPQDGSSSNSYLTIPGLQSEDASSMSDVSGISAASYKTYIAEESSLVLETLEEGRHHHYLIPTQVAKRGRFKKRGIKLHVYLDHIFVARHIKLGTVCKVCEVLIPLRLGKQAYVCRDCGITTHKPCHVKVETHCIHTSLPSMELEYYNESSQV